MLATAADFRNRRELAAATAAKPAGVELTTNYVLICDSVRINGANYLSAHSASTEAPERSPSPATAATRAALSFVTPVATSTPRT